MAPKRRGSFVGAPFATKKKRTVRRPVRQASPSSSSSSSSSTQSVNPSASSPQVDLFAGKIITTGRKVDFDFLDSEGFALGRQLKQMGWEHICSLDIPTYPSLVKEYYSNLARGDGGLVSSVRGSRIHLTAEILGKLLEIPIDGMVADLHSDRGAALSRLLGKEMTEFEEVSANQLPIEIRLLHNICSRILFPKTGRFEYVSERDIVIMDSVISGQPLNLPGMIIGYMAEAGRKKKATLPYGMVLTKVFRSQGVSILENEPSKKLRHTDYYNSATLHRMGFKKVNGVWIRKGQDELRATAADSVGHGPSGVGPSDRHHSSAPSCSLPPEAPPAPSAPPTPPTSSFAQGTTSFFDTQMDQLKSLLLNHKEEMKAELDSSLMGLKEMFHSLDTRVSQIESCLGSSSEALKSDIMLKFEELKDIGRNSDCIADLEKKISEASAFLDSRLNDFVKSQSDVMGNFLEDLKKNLKP